MHATARNACESQDARGASGPICIHFGEHSAASSSAAWYTRQGDAARAAWRSIAIQISRSQSEISLGFPHVCGLWTVVRVRVSSLCLPSLLSRSLYRIALDRSSRSLLGRHDTLTILSLRSVIC